MKKKLKRLDVVGFWSVGIYGQIGQLADLMFSHRVSQGMDDLVLRRIINGAGAKGGKVTFSCLLASGKGGLAFEDGLRRFLIQFFADQMLGE